MATVPILRRVCLMFCLCLISAVSARADNFCANDNLGGTILLKTDTALVANAVVGLHGSLTKLDGTVIPLYGTALVNATGDSMQIAVQGLQTLIPAPPLDPNKAGIHVGILINTDLTLNGTGTFETLTATGSANAGQGQRFLFDSSAVTWTATTCI